MTVVGSVGHIESNHNGRDSGQLGERGSGRPCPTLSALLKTVRLHS